MNEFWNDQIEVGYYDKIVQNGIIEKRGPRSYWHLTTLLKVGEYLKNVNSYHLDYACGPGTLIGNFSKSKSIGVDISSKQIDYALMNYKKNGVFLTTDNFNFKDYKQSFDVITVLGLIEFLNDDEILKLIEKLSFTLKSKKSILLTTPNFFGITRVLELLQNKFGSVNYQEEHINKFTENKILELFSNNDTFELRIEKFLNISFLFSLFSHQLAWKIESIINKVFSNRFGSLFIVILTKKA